MKIHLDCNLKKLKRIGNVLGGYYEEDPEAIEKLIWIAVTRELRRAEEGEPGIPKDGSNDLVLISKRRNKDEL